MTDKLKDHKFDTSEYAIMDSGPRRCATCGVLTTDEKAALTAERDRLREEVERLKSSQKIEVLTPPLPESFVVTALREQVKERFAECNRLMRHNYVLMKAIDHALWHSGDGGE